MIKPAELKVGEMYLIRDDKFRRDGVTPFLPGLVVEVIRGKKNPKRVTGFQYLDQEGELNWLALPAYACCSMERRVNWIKELG